MLVVKPWISVESFPGGTCQTFCGVPGFSFSRTIGFGSDTAVAADPAVAGANIVRARIDNAKIETAMSNSFGFGGTNASLVFQRYDA